MVHKHAAIQGALHAETLLLDLDVQLAVAEEGALPLQLLFRHEVVPHLQPSALVGSLQKWVGHMQNWVGHMQN